MGRGDVSNLKTARLRFRFSLRGCHSKSWCRFGAAFRKFATLLSRCWQSSSSIFNSEHTLVRFKEEHLRSPGWASLNMSDFFRSLSAGWIHAACCKLHPSYNATSNHLIHFTRKRSSESEIGGAMLKAHEELEPCCVLPKRSVSVRRREARSITHYFIIKHG